MGTVIGLGVGVFIFPGPQGTVTQSVTVTSQVTVTRTGFGLVEYAFSPGGKCANLVIKWIQKANSTIHILIYSFTLDIVRDALIQAKNRGVDVKIVMEKENWNGSGSEYMALKNAGINVRLDSNSHLMHDKVAIIDGHIILTGSFNWSAAGNTDNDENLVVLDSQTWASAYETQFQIIYSKAT
jgi:phosphatidylserine/phosphatidylglycerophosphate/cardiolipin synthase-like enzyme